MHGKSMTNVGLAVKNSKTQKDIEEVISTVPGFVSRVYDPRTPFDILLLEIQDEFQKELEHIKIIQESGSAKEIFLTSSLLDPAFLIEAMRMGVKEFFPQPLKTEEVKAALLKYKKQENGNGNGRGKGKIINIVGSKGGIGTTTIAVNLAANLNQAKGSPSVALIDMNLLFGEIPIFLNLEAGFNWGELVQNISRVDPIYLMSIMTKHPSGLYVLPSPTGLDGINLASPEIMEKILGLMRDVFDFIVIDSGQTLDDISLKILEMSDTVFIAAILSLPCLSNVKKLLWIFKRIGYPSEEKVKIIVNRFHKKSLISLKEAEKALNQEISHLIANDYQTTMSAINQGKPLSMVAPKEDVSRNMGELAQSLIEVEKGGVAKRV
jgi:pilus assembly protein CpaE